MAITLAFVLLKPKPKLSSGAIRKWLAENAPELPPSTTSPGEKGQLILNLGVVFSIIASMPTPYPAKELEGPCATSIFWPTAAEDIKGTTSHFIVSLMSSDQDEDPVNNARVLTRIVCSVLATCPEAVGVYWGNAALLIPSELFLEMAGEMLPEALPVDLWIDFRVGPNDDGSTSGFTHGLAAFGHKEMETETATEDPGDLRGRLNGLAGYLLDNGPVIEDGHTVGADVNEKISVKFAKSAFGHDGQVMRLEYGSPKKKKRR